MSKVDTALRRIGKAIDEEMNGLDAHDAEEFLERLAEDIEGRAEEVYEGDDDGTSPTPLDLDLLEGD